MSIEEIRRQIDELDQSLLQLLNQRAEKAITIGRLKQANKGQIFDPARERQVLDRLSALNAGPLSNEAVRAIFSSVFAAHRLLEKRLVVAYYGQPGSFTHIAGRRKFGEGADLRPMEAIADVFAAVEKKEADLGVVPIENTTAGVIPMTLDAFVESRLRICAEIYVDIEHYLLSRCRTLDEVKRVYSHPQPLAQCRSWLRANLPRVEVITTSSSSRAVEIVAYESGSAAISSELAGELYQVPVLCARIQDESYNRTRFFVIGNLKASPTGHDKTSLVFFVAHKAGALYQALGVFSNHQINLTFIQSHPTKQTPWEYMFFVDILGHADDPKVATALAELRDQTLGLRVLGSYPEDYL